MSRYGKKKTRIIPQAPASAAVRATSVPPVAPPTGVLLLDRRQVAALLNVSLSTVNRLVKSGVLPGRITLGNRVLYHRPTIESWIAAQVEVTS
jgi:excisionase family DNA binding protein